jgi:hypothetical protein
MEHNNRIVRLFHILKYWKERLPNVDRVSAEFDGDIIILHVNFGGEMTGFHYVKRYSVELLDSLYDFNSLEDMFFNSVEGEYMRLEAAKSTDVEKTD